MNPQDPKNLNNGRSMDVMPTSGQTPGSLNQPQQPQPPQPPQAVPQPQNSVMAPADDIAQATQSPEMAHEEKKTSRGNPKKTLIIIGSVIVLLLALLGAGIFINAQNNKDEDPVAETVQTETPVNNERVTTDEIDNTIKEIDNTMNTLNDSEDFKPDDLKDSTLGL